MTEFFIRKFQESWILVTKYHSGEILHTFPNYINFWIIRKYWINVSSNLLWNNQCVIYLQIVKIRRTLTLLFSVYIFLYCFRSSSTICHNYNWWSKMTLIRCMSFDIDSIRTNAKGFESWRSENWNMATLTSVQQQQQ